MLSVQNQIEARLLQCVRRFGECQEMSRVIPAKSVGLA